eukprot:1319414-Amphidinium_carterae.1
MQATSQPHAICKWKFGASDSNGKPRHLGYQATTLRVLVPNLNQKPEAVQDNRAYLVKVNYQNAFEATGAG